MPISETETKVFNNIKSQLADLERAIAEDMDAKLKSLSKLNTGGKAPNLEEFTDQDLHNIFELLGEQQINPIDYNHKDPAIRKFSAGRIAESRLDEGGKLTAEALGREELEKFVVAFLEPTNNRIDSVELGMMQVRLASTLELGGADRVKSLKRGLQDLKTQVEKRDGLNTFNDEGLTERINQAERSLPGTLQRHGELASHYHREATNLKLDSIRQESVSPKVRGQKMMEILPSSTALGKKDLRGVDLSGIDLSGCDMSMAVLDGPTLARTTGLSSIKGVEPEVLREAKDLSNLVKKQQQLEKKLSELSKPWSFERFKAFFNKGGADKIKTETAGQLDQIRREHLRRSDPQGFENLNKGEAALLMKETLKTPSLNEAFTKFAKQQGHGGDIEFVNMVDSLRKQASAPNPDLGELQILAHGIKVNLVDENRLPLDYETKDRLNEAFKGLDDMNASDISKLFSDAQREVRNRLATGPLQKFKQSEEFHNAQKNAFEPHLKVKDALGTRNVVKNSPMKHGHHLK